MVRPRISVLAAKTGRNCDASPSHNGGEKTRARGHELYGNGGPALGHHSLSMTTCKAATKDLPKLPLSFDKMGPAYRWRAYALGGMVRYGENWAAPSPGDIQDHSGFRPALARPAMGGPRVLGMGRDSRKFIDIPGPVILEAGGRDGWTFTGPKGAFHPIARIDLVPFLNSLTGPFEIEVLVDLKQGVIGVGLTDDFNNHLPDSELVADSSSDAQTLTLRFSDRAKHLVIRNRHEDRSSNFTMLRVRLRESA